MLVALGMSLAATSAAAQTVDEIVATNLEARGGVERLRAIQSVKTSGTMTATPPGRETPLSLKVSTWMKRPNKMRRETVFPDRSIVVGFDGSTVWAMDSAMGKPQQMTGPQADQTREQIAIDPLFLDYKQKGHRIELVGPETIDGVRTHHLRITKKNGQVAHHYLSADTGLEVRTVDTFDQGGMKAEIRTDLSDYRTIDGMSVPFSLKQYNNGRLMADLALDSVEFNGPMADDLFVMK